METLWTALASAGATLVVALASTGLTGRMAANRERERLTSEERRERHRLKSEEQRERDRLEAQARSDNEARLFEHRRAAIENVVKSFTLYRKAAREAFFHYEAPPGEDAVNHMEDQLADVRTYCSRETVRAAERVLQALIDEEFGAQEGTTKEDPWTAFRGFQEAAQADLGAAPQQ